MSIKLGSIALQQFKIMYILGGTIPRTAVGTKISSRHCEKKNYRLETVSIADPLQNRQHAQNP